MKVLYNEGLQHVLKSLPLIDMHTHGSSVNLNLKQYFPALTGIRIIAAYGVFIHHNNYIKYLQLGEGVNNFFSELSIGVSLFFVLSGFLIANRYYENKISLRTYFINRFARIYPVFFLLTTFTFFVLWFQGRSTFDDIKVYFFNITFLKGYFQDIAFSLIPPSWSLTVEETFYILAPFLFFFVRRKAIWIFFFPILLITIGYFLVYISTQINLHEFMASKIFMVLGTFFGRSTEFFVGIGLALFHSKYSTTFKTRHFTAIGGLIILFYVYVLSRMVDEQHTSGVMTNSGMIIHNFLLPLTGISIFYWGLLTESTFLSKILSSKIFDLLGKSSYVFYLIHNSIIATFLFTIVHDFWQFILLNLISILLFKLYEEPLNRLIRKVSKKN